VSATQLRIQVELWRVGHGVAPLAGYLPIIPSTGDDALAESFLGILIARVAPRSSSAVQPRRRPRRAPST
jgi:hypothetical protein